MLIRLIKENINFHLELADQPLMVLADAGQIEQILINLAALHEADLPMLRITIQLLQARLSRQTVPQTIS